MQRHAAERCHYTPGELERPWFEGKVAGSICKRLASAQQQNGTQDWLTFAAAARGSAPKRPSPQQTALMSRFDCRDMAEGSFIEPLTGGTRHPLADLKHWRWYQTTPSRLRLINKSAHCTLHGEQNAGLFNISHLILANECGQAPAAGRALYFDLGCTTWTMNSTQSQSPFSGDRPSLPLMQELYRRNCIEFDHIWAWEAKAMDPKVWWNEVPVDVRAKLSFFNVGVPKEPHPNGAVALLKAAAKPEDFVVVKMDIDNAQLEHSIVNELLSDRSFAELVDEFFFEYHFVFDNIEFGWGRQGKGHTVDEALRVMRRLRTSGIRSHFWV